jgi:PAS domain S-box-containing protein
VADRPPLQRFVAHVRKVTSLGSADAILAASCREVVEFTGAERAFASCCLPSESWEQGTHIDTRAESPREVSVAARSALFAVHRRLSNKRQPLRIDRNEQTRVIFAGLDCGPDNTAIYGVPLIHRTGRLWGHFVLVGEHTKVDADGLLELTELTTLSLENAQRLAFARRDQDRLLLLAAATDDAMYDWNFDTRDFWWGAGVTRLLGSTPDQIAGTGRWKYDQIHPDDVERVRASFDAARFSKAMRWNADYRMRRSEGHYVDVEDRAYFLRDVDGRAYRSIGIIRDVTATKELLKSEQEARAQAEGASRAKDEFLAMLGHELRNPLAPIVTGLELIQLRGTLDIDRDIPVMQRQANHLIRLVDDLLDISRITHGKIELDKQRIEIASVVESALETASPLLEARKHAVSVDVPSVGLEVHGDRARLIQVIANVVNNAAKYTDPGGIIEIIARRANDQIEVRIRDTGIGIAPEILPRVFTMFVQERQAIDRSQGGLGLGLAIVRSLVELHGGQVQAHSAGIGRGTEVTVRLPRAVTADVVVTPNQLPAAAASGRRKIMVVDDNEDAAELLCTLLETMGNTTCVAHDPLDALAKVEAFKPDLAVLDIGLPVMDGYELARRLRHIPSIPGLRLIALTGYGQPSDRERAVSAGFDEHLVKPVAVDKLQHLITKLTS